MNAKEKAIISKLLSIATKQQKIIHKLAQVQPMNNEVVDYLKRAVDTAAVNSNIQNPLSVLVKFNTGDSQNNTRIEDTYTVTIGGLGQASNELKNLFLKNYLMQVKTQKPELDGLVSVIFA